MKKRIFRLVFLLLCIFTLAACRKDNSIFTIDHLLVNYLNNPVGIDTNPVFSWRMQSDLPNQEQVAYQIVVADSEASMKKKQYYWDSGRIESGASIAIPYEGPELVSEHRYYWKVFVWNQDEELAESLDTAFFETGILNENEWENAQWICKSTEENMTSEIDSTYSIQYDVRINQCQSGFIWGADKSDTGEY